MGVADAFGDTGFRAAALLHRPAIDDPAGDHPEVESMTFAGSSKSQTQPALHVSVFVSSLSLRHLLSQSLSRSPTWTQWKCPFHARNPPRH
jgi:hypothetical protein